MAISGKKIQKSTPPKHINPPHSSNIKIINDSKQLLLSLWINAKIKSPNNVVPKPPVKTFKRK